MTSEENRSLYTMVKSENEQVQIILHNVLMMLSNRIYLDEEGNGVPLIEDINKVRINQVNETVHQFEIDNGTKYSVLVTFQRLTATSKSSIINDFLGDYPEDTKIVVAENYNKKTYDFVEANRTQIFKISMLLENIIDNYDQPKFQLLTPNEMKQIRQDYNLNEYTGKKILSSDPIARYYNLSRGDIIRIIRASPTSGEAIDYRIVAK